MSKNLAKDQPNGGFLPIYLCEKKDDSDKDNSNKDISKREYKTPSLSISIKTLMEKRREKNPLLQK